MVSFGWKNLPRFEQFTKLPDELDIMIAGGEKNQMVHEFKMFIDNDCYDILQGTPAFEGISAKDCSFSRSKS